MSRRNRLIAAGLCVVLALVVALAWMIRGAPSQQPAAKGATMPPEPTVVGRTELQYPPGAPQLDYLRSEPARAFPEPLIEPLNGRVTYDENRTARVSSPVAGRVLTIGAEPGDRVGAGHLLALVDAPEHAQAVSDLRRAEAEAQQQRAQHARARLLFEGEVLSRREMEAAEASRAQAEAEFERARRRLANLSRGSADAAGGYRLISPLAGVVTERRLNPGSEVRPDLPDPLFVISDLTRAWVLIELPERLLGKIARGQEVSVESDAFPGVAMQGRIAQIGDVVDAATRRVLVRCVVDNTRRMLRPEMYVRVTPIPDEHARFVRVPNSAIITQGVRSYVFIEREPGVFVKREVKLGLQARDFTFIHEGIAEGEAVVISGALRLNAEFTSAN